MDRAKRLLLFILAKPRRTFQSRFLKGGGEKYWIRPANNGELKEATCRRRWRQQVMCDSRSVHGLFSYTLKRFEMWREAGQRIKTRVQT